MTRRIVIGIVSLAALVGTLTAGTAGPSLVGDYHGTVRLDSARVRLGDTSDPPPSPPIEFTPSVDLSLRVELSGDTYTGSLSFRRIYPDLQGRLAEVRGPLARLVINDDGSFTATSMPIRFLLDGRTIERIVTLTGTFNVSEDSPCIPTIKAAYNETMNGLVFEPVTLSGPLSMTRTQDTEADDACLGDPLPLVAPPQ